MRPEPSHSPIAARLTAALADRYRIEREVGRGGMATVYLARDLRHDRLVALKVLDPELGAVLGADRFLSEIRVTANLQHPNLLPLFDSGQADGLLFYVMPFVEGDSLRVRLEREKQLPVDDAVRIATAVANALDYAHSHGVIHRDLKPENILLQHGQPVVADFGIALAVSVAGGTPVTQTGLSLGTPQYMSPEQATGDRVIDGRTDIYSLAAMTYEMLTGEPPHSGTSAQAIIAKLMTTQPQPVRVLRPSVPGNVAMAVERGLAKLPADRFGTAREFAQALSNTAFTTGTAYAAPPQVAPRASRLAPALGALAAVSTIAALWGWLRPAEPKQVLRYELGIDSSVSIIPTGRWGRAALSPDGSMLVYVGGPRNGLMLRRRDQLEAAPIPGADQVGAPAFSPDGKRIASIQGARSLMIVGLDGTPPVAVTDSLLGVSGLAWAGNDTIYVDASGAYPLVKVAARARSIPEFVAPLDSTLKEIDQVYPEVLPDGWVLYTMQRTALNHAIAVLDPRTGVRKVLVENARRPRYAAGHLLYVTTDGVLMSAPFDASAHVVRGAAVVVASGLPLAANAIDLTVSGSGTLSYVSSPDGAPQRELVWFSRDGKAEVLDSTWRLAFSDPAISPDGLRIAVSDGTQLVSTAGRGDIWVKPLSSSAKLRMTVQGGQNRGPVWTRDGKWLLYISASSTWAIIENPADGSIAPVRRLEAREPIITITATPDGEWVVYQRGTGSNARLYAHKRGDTTSVRVLAEAGRETVPMLSPDGRFLAFAGYESGQNEVYVAPFPNPGSVRWAVSDGTGTEPVWANSGKELFYRDPSTASMMAVSVDTGAGFSVGAPRRLFTMPGQLRFAVSRDDSRFLIPRPVGQVRARDRLMMVENWVESLRAGREGK